MKFSMELARSCFQPKLCPLLHSIFWSFNGLWVKIGHRNKTTCSEFNPVQSTKSKLMSCPRNGRVFRFKLNSTATSDGRVQKLESYVWHDSESSAAKLVAHELQGWGLPQLITTTVLAREQRPRSHHKGSTGRVEEATNCIQFYAIANLDKTWTRHP